jgi:hypothetical protein
VTINMRYDYYNPQELVELIAQAEATAEEIREELKRRGMCVQNGKAEVMDIWTLLAAMKEADRRNDAKMLNAITKAAVASRVDKGHALLSNCAQDGREASYREGADHGWRVRQRTRL